MKAIDGILLRYGIVASGTARMTPEYSLNSKNTTLESTVFLDRLYTVFGARGSKSAFCRPHQGGNTGSVEPDQKNHDVLHLNQSVPFACRAQGIFDLAAFAIQNIVPGDEQEIVPDG